MKKKLIANVKTMGDVLVVQATHRVCIDDGQYLVTISDDLKNRSDRQNALMWSIINKICIKLNGNTRDSYDLYCQILEMAGADYEEYACKHIALEDAKTLLKHVKVVAQEVRDGELWDFCWVFTGISSMTSKQANRLIEEVKNYAGEVGVDVDDEYWKGLLNER